MYDIAVIAAVTIAMTKASVVLDPANPATFPMST
jgi:hypothetical protein